MWSIFGETKICAKLYRGNCRTQRNMFIIICGLDYVYEKLEIDDHLKISFHGIIKLSYKFYLFHTGLFVRLCIGKEIWAPFSNMV